MSACTLDITSPTGLGPVLKGSRRLGNPGELQTEDSHCHEKAASLNTIEKAIENLSPEEQLRLVEKVAHRLRRTGIAKKDLEWGQLYGLGKGLWKEDAQEYVNRSREDRG
ncbi:MAG: hypothetical protein A4E57_00381 [Syntrophorhabdaceae bacterium PtaU1.Bin034]|nr:MAG: hypothetical protein A4E57_00381 [Syntrophorhabdaceae bacterium PtaU1.Bin034]